VRAVACCLWCLLPLPAQAPSPVVVGVPAAVAPAVQPVLASAFGAEVRLEPIAAASASAVPGVDVYLLVDEWMLARGAGVGLYRPLPEGAVNLPAAPVDRERRFVLPFAADYAVGIAAEVRGPIGSPVVWEALALRPELHDRLGLVLPEVDGSPWLLAMRHRLEAGDGSAAGFALWTTLDARAGVLRAGYADLLRDLAAGRLAAAVAPREVLAATAATQPGRLSVEPLAGPSRARFGLAIAAAGSPEALAVAAKLLQPASLRALATAAGLELAAATPDPLPAADGLAFWLRYEANVRGRGRGVERLAEWLDLGLLAAFLLALWLLLRSQRRREAP
jgi:hypothetical protein